MHRSVQLLDLHRSRLLGSLQTINEKKGKKTCISEYYLPGGDGGSYSGRIPKSSGRREMEAVTTRKSRTAAASRVSPLQRLPPSIHYGNQGEARPLFSHPARSGPERRESPFIIYLSGYPHYEIDSGNRILISLKCN